MGQTSEWTLVKKMFMHWECVLSQYEEQKDRDIWTRPKLRTFSFSKSEYEVENYVLYDSTKKTNDPCVLH